LISRQRSVPVVKSRNPFHARLDIRFRAQEVQPTDYPQLKQLTWEKVAIDPPGILMIDRYRESPDIFVPDRKLMEGDGLPLAAVVFAKMVIHSDADVRRQLIFDYSDEIVMYLNGHPIFTEGTAWDTARPVPSDPSGTQKELLLSGIIGVRQDAVLVIG
jgi:hypothetical protein